MFGGWKRLWSRFFGKKVVKPGFNIPAPATLVGRIERLDDQERDLVRIAEEALRRGYPEQAAVAYRKVIKFYVEKGFHPKALSVLIALLRLQPNDEEAWLQRATSCEALSRRSDAARAFFQAGMLAEGRGDRVQALARYERCLELDFRTAGLQQRYVALGGTKDAWSRDLPPGAVPVDPVQVEASAQASAIALVDTTDGFLGDSLLEPGGDRTSIEESVDLDLGLPVERAPIAKVQPIRFSIPNQSTAWDSGLPSSLIGSEHQEAAMDDSDDVAALLTETGDLDQTDASDPDLSDPALSDPDLEDPALADDGNLTVAMPAIPDARTEAYDASALAGLLAKARTGRG